MDSTHLYGAGIVSLLLFCYSLSVFIAILVYIYGGESDSVLLYLKVAAFVFLILYAIGFLLVLFAVPYVMRFSEMHLTYNDLIHLNQ